MQLDRGIVIVAIGLSCASGMLVACGGGASCEDAVANGMKVSGMGGATYGKERAQAIKTCKDDKWSAKARSCFAELKQVSDLGACAALTRVDRSGGGGDDPQAGRRSEADLQLNRLSKAAKTYYAERAEFPTGQIGPTPAAPCCDGPNHKCPVDPAAWRGNLWEEAFEFEVDEPGYFRYAVVSDGKTLTAKASGDLDCDGTEVTYELRCTSTDGMPSCNVTKPTTQD